MHAHQKIMGFLCQTCRAHQCGSSLLCQMALVMSGPHVLCHAVQGFGNVNAILEASGADYAPGALLQIVAAKIVTTSICRGSGLVGGIYAPSIFMGALPRLRAFCFWPFGPVPSQPTCPPYGGPNVGLRKGHVHVRLVALGFARCVASLHALRRLHNCSILKRCWADCLLVPQLARQEMHYSNWAKS